MEPLNDQPGDVASVRIGSPVALVLLAAGVGRRFGGLKQLEPVGPDDEAILEYTAFDAVRAGVGRVLLVVRPETEREFRQSVGKRIARFMDVVYVHQRMDDPRNATQGKPTRTRPWGTAHAVLCACAAIEGPFIVANADDFYGGEAIAAAVDHLRQSHGASHTHALIGYRLVDTLPQAGRVSRAVCTTADELLTDLVEMPEVWREGDSILGRDADGAMHRLDADASVSMNLWAFRPRLHAQLQNAFDLFLREHGDSHDAEFQLPVVVRDLVRSGQACVRVIPWRGSWCGVTHRADLDGIRAQLRALTDSGRYPCPLVINHRESPFNCIRLVASNFAIDGELTAIAPLRGGHIHESHVATLQSAAGMARFVIQRINTAIFADVDGMMDNVARVCDHLHRRICEKRSAEVDRRVLTYVSTRSGSLLHCASDGSCWRMCRFIEKSTSIEFPRAANDAANAGGAFGDFHAMLADLPPPALRETIPHFHDTPRRFTALNEAIAADSHLRVDGVRTEIEFARSHQSLAGALIEPMGRGELPVRIAHNDAKLSNVLLDADSGEPLCVVDLDTVMPGTVLFDFGDMMRTMLCPAAEDERDLSKVRIERALFAGLVRGYLHATRDLLTPVERSLLVTAGMVITYEQGIRFLTDYLRGDQYYQTTRAAQNLDRCRVQFALLMQLEQHRADLESVVAMHKPS